LKKKKKTKHPTDGGTEADEKTRGRRPQGRYAYKGGGRLSGGKCAQLFGIREKQPYSRGWTLERKRGKSAKEGERGGLMCPPVVKGKRRERVVSFNRAEVRGWQLTQVWKGKNRGVSTAAPEKRKSWQRQGKESLLVHEKISELFLTRMENESAITSTGKKGPSHSWRKGG